MTPYTGRIEITPGVCGGRPRIAGHRVRVQDIAVWHGRLGRTPEQISTAFPQLSPADIHAALAYYLDHRDEIERQIQEDEAFVTRLRAETGPGPVECRMGSESAGGDSVSSLTNTLPQPWQMASGSVASM